MRASKSAISVMFVAVGVAACAADRATGPQDEVPALDFAIASAALGDVGVSAAMSDPSLALLTPFPGGTVTIDRTQNCPAGGSTRVTGTASVTGDTATRTFTHSTDLTQTVNQCAVAVRNGVIVTANGATRTQMVRTIAQGAQLTATTTQTGAMTFSSSDGRSHSCETNVTGSVNFAARTYTVTGTVCGRAVNVTRTFPVGP